MVTQARGGYLIFNVGHVCTLSEVLAGGIIEQSVTLSVDKTGFRFSQETAVVQIMQTF